MIFATGSTYSQGTPAPDWMAHGIVVSNHGGHSQGTPAPDWMAPVMGVVIGREIN